MSLFGFEKEVTLYPNFIYLGTYSLYQVVLFLTSVGAFISFSFSVDLHVYPWKWFGGSTPLSSGQFAATLIKPSLTKRCRPFGVIMSFPPTHGTPNKHTNPGLFMLKVDHGYSTKWVAVNKYVRKWNTKAIKHIQWLLLEITECKPETGTTTNIDTRVSVKNMSLATRRCYWWFVKVVETCWNHCDEMWWHGLDSDAARWHHGIAKDPEEQKHNGHSPQIYVKRKRYGWTGASP